MVATQFRSVASSAKTSHDNKSDFLFFFFCVISKFGKFARHCIPQCAKKRTVGPRVACSLLQARSYRRIIISIMKTYKAPIAAFGGTVQYNVNQLQKKTKNSSRDEIANVNFYAVLPEGTRIL